MLPPASPSILLTDIASYHREAEASLRLYFSPANPNYVAIFAGLRPSDVSAMLDEMLSETDMRSALVVMARIEAAFRVDYLRRCERKNADSVSIQFRKLAKKKGRSISLEDELLEVWRNENHESKQVIGQLKGAFKFRHWLAHGRYWNMGNKYDFQTLYALADGIAANFPLYG